MGALNNVDTSGHLPSAKLSLRLLRGPRSQDYAALAGFGGLIVGIVPLILAFADAVSKPDWTAAAAWGFFLTALGVTAVMSIPHRPEPLPPPTTIFEPFVQVSEIKTWPRPAEVGELRKRLAGSEGTLVLVAGVSGGGKTVLLQRLLPDVLGLQPESYRYVNTYVSFLDTLAPLAALPSSGAPTITVLDQFEQYVAWLQSLPSKQRGVTENKTLDLCRALVADPSSRLIVAVREEWYYQLRWLKELVPSPETGIDVSGPSPDRGDATHEVILDLLAALAEPNVAETVISEIDTGGSLLPLEVQIVGATIERAQRENKITADYFHHDLGGVEGSITRYFDSILASLPDPRVALKVLCALSARTRFRRQEELSDIMDVLFEDGPLVSTAVAELTKQGLVIPSGPGRYELAHDYLAEFFHQKSGSELEPIDRDNILFHIEGGPERATGLVASRQDRDAAGRWGFATVVILPLVLVMTARLLYLGLPWTLAQHVRPAPLFGSLLDQSYLPIFIVHMAWVVYVGLLYHRILRHLRESRAAKWCSRCAVLNMAACVLVAVLIPSAWLAAIAWGGLVVGFRLVFLARNKTLNSTAKKRVRAWGWSTAANMGFVGILGGTGIALTSKYVHSVADARTWTLVSAVLATAMTYVCYALCRIHVRREAVSQLLGLLSRGSSYLMRRA